MRNFTRDVEPRLLLAMTHTEYQVCSLLYIHFFFFFLGLRFFMIVCLCNCRSLRQSCIVTPIPTRGRVSWKHPPLPQHHHQVALRQLFPFLLSFPFNTLQFLSYLQMRRSRLNIVLIYINIYIYIFFFFPFCCIWFTLGVTFGPILTTSLRFSPYDGCKIDLKSLTRWFPLKIVQNIIAGFSLQMLHGEWKRHVSERTCVIQWGALKAIAIKWNVRQCF